MLVLIFQAVIFVTIVFSGKYRWAVAAFWAVETLSLVFTTWLTFLQLGTIVFALYESYVTENYVPIGTDVDLPCPECGKVAPYPSVESWERKPRVCPHCKFRSITGSTPIRLRCVCGHAELETFESFRVSEYFGFCGSCNLPWFIRRNDSSISAFFCENCLAIDLRHKADSDHFDGNGLHNSGHLVQEIEPSNQLLALHIRMGRIRNFYYRNLIRKFSFGRRFPQLWSLLGELFRLRTVAIIAIMTFVVVGSRIALELKANLPTKFEKCGSPDGFENAVFNVSQAKKKLSNGGERSGKFACIDLRDFSFKPGEYGELQFYNVRFGDLVLNDLDIGNLIIKKSDIGEIRITRTRIGGEVVVSDSNPDKISVDGSVAKSVEISGFVDLRMNVNNSELRLFEVTEGAKMQLNLQESRIKSFALAVKGISRLEVSHSSFCGFIVSVSRIQSLQMQNNQLADTNGEICESLLHFYDVFVFRGNIDFLQFKSIQINKSNVSRLNMQNVYGDEIFVTSSYFSPSPLTPSFVVEYPRGIDPARCIGCVLFSWPTTTSTSSSSTEFVPTTTTLKPTYNYDELQDCELPDYVYDEEGNRSIRCN